ncbi:linalool dehydratase/isomerase domain-containing protein [Streptomyces capitiformicae]|uniref:Linalool dehydratase/isomerase domain-containing protein n=1 Tax=Streptomyces capitiformicae TaxID=2014920 RepID=A0A918Z8D9_9ACTN|nr:hypothetical protein [Streptomyces capitiformicae]GHE41573.1 hypothetical protein GCM10017771_60870 [Streptomyces capitiformicae]
MTVIADVRPADVLIPKKRRDEGPVVTLRLRRARVVHAALCLLGAVPWLLGLSVHVQAIGWGLWLPGAGFLAVPGLWQLLFPVTLLLFGVAFIAWFGSGMTTAPIAVWALAALGAGAAAGGHSTSWAPAAVPGLTLSFVALGAVKRRRGRAAAAHTREERNSYLPAAVSEIQATAVPAPPLATRELSDLQLGMMRYILGRALQPVGQLEGFDKIDQFQTSSLRYQLNQVGWALAVAQRHYTPNFTGYVSEGQRRAIDQYLQRQIWGYWRWESAWGNLNFDFDPAKQDNIMLTGYININTLLYQNNTGDDRYAEPGSLTFVYDDRRSFRHDAHTINGSLMDNYRGQVYRQPYCLFPCEPNWIYTSCNFRGLTAVLLHDTVFGTDHTGEIKDTFRKRLEEEFVNADGSMVALRSKLTGHALPFPVPDASLVKMLSPFFPDLAYRYYALARRDMLAQVDGTARVLLDKKALDYGNYKSTHVFTLDGILGAAREIGDTEAATAAEQALDELGDVDDSGAVHWATGSNMANLMVMESHFGVAGGWREIITTRPSAEVLSGPVLAEASYPEVLVASAVSDGTALDLVLAPGAAPGSPQSLTITRLRPGVRYQVRGAGSTTLDADARGQAVLRVALHDRTRIRIVPGT